jgi:hypothetical protein
MEIIFLYTGRTVPISNSGIVETEIQSMTITHYIHDYSLSWLGTGTSVKSGWFKLV